MTRIFARISLGILAAVVISTAAAINIFQIQTIADWEENSPAALRCTRTVLDELTKNLSDEELKALVARLPMTGGAAIEITSLDDPRIEAETRERLSADKGAWLRYWKDRKIQGEGVMFLMPFARQNRVFVMGPEAPSLTDMHIFESISAIVIVSVLIVGFFLSRGLVSGLHRLEQTALKIAGGDLGARADVRSKDAIGSLASTFNNMAGRIEELLNHQRQLVQAVAHELRTPISRVRFGIEMQAIAPSEEEKEKRSLDIEAELDELDGLVEELLVFSRYDSGKAALSPGPVDLHRLIQAQIDQFAPLHKGILFVLKPFDSKGAEVNVDALSLDRVIRNLVSNAARYAKEKVVVEAELSKTEITVRVDDDGPGIAEGDRERIFEPFTRLDQSRNRASGGTGLGLAIVNRIMKANGGKVEVANSELGGASFSTHWPIANSTEDT